MKARVYDKVTKTMHILGSDTHDSIKISESGELFYYNMQNGECSEFDAKDEKERAEFSYALMWSIGKLDKNGQEIYEGDIVETILKIYDKITATEVVIKVASINDDTPNVLTRCKELKVKGNIYSKKMEEAGTDDKTKNYSKLRKFKQYFDELYGTGLEVANWHQNGDKEPFDNFYDNAIEYMESED